MCDQVGRIMGTPRWMGALAVPGRVLIRAGVRTPTIERLTQRAASKWARETVGRTNHGVQMHLNTRDLIQRFIWIFGQWEPALTEHLRRSLRPGDGFIDVGANVGYFTLLASRLIAPSGTVVAVEPAPDCAAGLRANIALNGVRNVRVVEAAITSKPGSVYLRLGSERNSGVARLTSHEHATGVIVDGRSFAQLIRIGELEAARFVKIDVEGAERDVIESVLPTLSRSRDDLELMVELDAGTAEVVDMMRAEGFHPYCVANRYSPEGYLDQSRMRPQRLEEAIREQTDVIFSRVDGAML